MVPVRRESLIVLTMGKLPNALAKADANGERSRTDDGVAGTLRCAAEVPASTIAAVGGAVGGTLTRPSCKD